MPKHPNLRGTPIEEMRDEFLACRALRHAWEPIGATPGGRRPQFGELVTLRCIRCGGLRYDKFSRITGERLGKPQYDQAPGYKASESHSFAWWRAAWAETISDMIVSSHDNVTPIKRGKAS
jgi:hypothetical protein